MESGEGALRGAAGADGSANGRPGEQSEAADEEHREQRHEGGGELERGDQEIVQAEVAHGSRMIAQPGPSAAATTSLAIR